MKVLDHDPDQATEDQLRQYLLFVTEKRGWSSSTVNVTLQALKLYFRITCPRDWQVLKLSRVQVEQKLPVVITVGEVQTLLKLIEKPSMRCFFTVVYALGLRLQEALNLQVADIDSKRMMVHVHRGKGAKDRMIPLPEMALLALRTHWAKFKQLMRQAGLLEQIEPVVWQKAWNVNCQAVGDGRHSLRYLAPYVFRVAIGNHRIRRVEVQPDGSGWVTFMVKPSGKRSYRPMKVTAQEFIRRFLQHVLPRGWQKVRHYTGPDGMLR